MKALIVSVIFGIIAIVVESIDYSEELYNNYNGKAIIEVIEGTCIDDDGNGISDEGYYINYSGVDGTFDGCEVTTYVIHLPGETFDSGKRIDIICTEEN